MILTAIVDDDVCTNATRLLHYSAQQDVVLSTQINHFVWKNNNNNNNMIY